jgi:hypothetical protein
MIIFLFGTGSDHHDQLLLSTFAKDFYEDVVYATDLDVSGEDAHLLNSIVLVTPKSSKDVSSIEIRPKALYAGVGHCTLVLTDHNDLYLWGWNECVQLGSIRVISSTNTNIYHSHKVIMTPVIQNLGIKVSMAAFGQSHTLFIELSSGKLYFVGDDHSRGIPCIKLKSVLQQYHLSQRMIGLHMLLLESFIQQLLPQKVN